MPAAIEAKVFQDKNTVAIARNLLGKLLVRARPDGTAERRRIVELEAYHGTEDLACHAARGRTARTETMFAPGGVWYVYLCYGIHELLNLVTGPAEHPAAVLIRGVDTVSGPGRLTRALGIDRRLNGRPAAPASGLWLEDDGFVVARSRILATPRIGVDYAGPVWSAKKWRFTIASTSATSRPVRSGLRRSG